MAEAGAGRDPARQAELAARLAGVRERVGAACAAVGRQPGELTLVAVSKTRPASDVALLRDLGLGDFGENKDQEARAKAAEVPDVRWHVVGRLQSGKARSVVAYADVVHSLDRPRLAHALSDAAERAGRTLEALVQVSLDGDPERGGAVPADVPALADLVAELSGLRLGGVMAVAPLGADPRTAFARLAEIAQELLRQHPDARTVSAGMSGDLEDAVAEGATCLRVGSALFGPRPPLLR
ncbi:MAG: YggS family pyridoxal phosphate-dependent enzyme [Actinomycetota bacterium]|nr:YggS family pyridoxal phosphate-dependent enzyme [Actinomycetota bacterium]